MNSDVAFELEDAALSYDIAGGESVTGLEPTTWQRDIGTTAAVVGRSGSGKSSMISLLSTMRRPTSGRVAVLGTDVGTASMRTIADLRAHAIGVVFQSFHLDSRETTWWNVALPWVFAGGGSLSQARRRADHALSKVGLDGLGERRADDLSGGQRQRVAIARAMMSQPKLLVADEPTGNLDEPTANAIAELIYGLADDGVAVVVVTHDMAIAQRAQHVVSLSRGTMTTLASS